MRNFVHFAALKFRDILGDVGGGSAPSAISKVSGLCPISGPIVGWASTFDMNDRSG